MKINLATALVSVGVFATVNAPAADKLLGPVVAMEREFPNSFNACVDQVTSNPDKPTGFFACKFPVLKNKSEFLVGQQMLLNLDKEGCAVEGTVQNSTLLIIFGTNPSRSHLESAKECLRKAIDQTPEKDTLKFVVYGVQGLK